MKSSTVFCIAALSLFVQFGRAQTPQLSYFKNYFVTGDYAVAGVGLSGKGATPTTTISMTTVPCTSGPGLLASVVPCTNKGAVPADVIAAFLYWETTETSSTPSAMNGSFDQNINPIKNNQNVLTGNPLGGLALGNPTVAACALTGGGTQSKVYTHVYRADVLKYLPIDQTNSVRLANGTHTVVFTGAAAGTQFDGATLVVIYRLVTPGNPRIAPLRSVVIYDGAFTGTSSPNAPLNQTMGGFYQASSNPAAKMTQIVGNGQSGFKETLTVNGSIPQGVPANPFVGAQGNHWDNYTFNVNIEPNYASVQTEVSLTQGCLSWGAIIVSTNVQDTDFDGLLDVWETSGLYFNPGVRYDGITPPAAPAPAPAPATFGTCTAQNSATCVNFPAMGANPFFPDIFVQIDWMEGNYSATHIHMPQLTALTSVGDTFKAHLVNIHFDVGNNYQGTSTSPRSPYIIPAQYAQGGNVVQESSILCTGNACAFSPESGQYSVLGWKEGFDAIKDGDTALGLKALFAQSRKDTFHYVLFGHALAAHATAPFSDPASISGVADRPGGDVLITLGLWRSDIPANDQVGSSLVQAGTLMHELGHNLDLSHYGWFRTPNCAPDYPSVMNYLYQTRGLTDAQGNEHIDYSYGLLLPVNEDSLSATAPLGLLFYRPRFFGPLAPGQPTSQASVLHCDGTILNNDKPEVRLEWPKISTPDWSNGNTTIGKTIPPTDVNYDGVIGESFTDQPDWISLNLQQVGARLNVNGLSVDVGQSDLGQSDLGQSDLGQSDLGQSDLGQSDLGQSDLGDINYNIQLLSGSDPPPSPSTACPTCGLTVTTSTTANTLSWTPPATGQVSSYNIYRCAVVAPATSCTPAAPVFMSVTVTPANAQAPTYPDTVKYTSSTSCSTCYNTTYVYDVTALVTVPPYSNESAPSNAASGDVTHSPTATTTAISSVMPSPTTAGHGVTIAVTVAPVINGGTPTGTVTVNSSPAALTCTATLSSAVGGCQLTFTTPGTQSITATYNADPNFNGSTTSNATMLTVNPAPAVTTATLPPTEAGHAYSQTIAASGGTGTLTFTPQSINGLTLSSTGALTGTPTATTIIPVTVTDSLGVSSATQNLTVTVYPALTLAAANLPLATTNFPYQPQQLMATGGTGTYANWTVTSGNASLPPGLTLNASSGVISGTTTSTDTGTHSFSVSVTDSLGFVAIQSYSITTGFTLEGNAVVSGTGIQLASAPGQDSQAWSGTLQSVESGFTASFQFQITPITGDTPADGFAFVIQNMSGTAQGQGGGPCGACLGYVGITNSIAVEFDTYDDSGAPFDDPNGNHIAIISNGTNANTASHCMTSSNMCVGGASLLAVTNPTPGATEANPTGITLTDGALHTVTITYSGPNGTLSVSVDSNPIVSTTVDLQNLLGLTNGTAWVGFTAANGAGGETAVISNWSLVP